jgi:hypothetical protein
MIQMRAWSGCVIETENKMMKALNAIKVVFDIVKIILMIYIAMRLISALNHLSAGFDSFR